MRHFAGRRLRWQPDLHILVVNLVVLLLFVLLMLMLLLLVVLIIVGHLLLLLNMMVLLVGLHLLVGVVVPPLVVVSVMMVRVIAEFFRRRGRDRVQLGRHELLASVSVRHRWTLVDLVDVGFACVGRSRLTDDFTVAFAVHVASIRLLRLSCLAANVFLFEPLEALSNDAEDDVEEEGQTSDRCSDDDTMVHASHGVVRLLDRGVNGHSSRDCFRDRLQTRAIIDDRQIARSGVIFLGSWFEIFVKTSWVERRLIDGLHNLIELVFVTTSLRSREARQPVSAMAVIVAARASSAVFEQVIGVGAV